MDNESDINNNNNPFPALKRPDLYVQRKSDYNGMTKLVCCRVFDVFKGDVFTCPTCNKRHNVPRGKSK